MSERYYGRFERQIALPTDVLEDKVSVPTVTLPKSEAAMQRAKRISIQVS
jgi:HSP20 family molecular chaperone IbpA